MPTNEDFNELLNRCIGEWANLEGVDGYKVSSKENNNWIFLPATGYRTGTFSYYVGAVGYYWSSTLNESNSYGAYDLRFSPNSKYTHSYYRYNVRSVRPVSE